MSNVDELLKACEELRVSCSFIQAPKASKYISQIIEKFKPRKITGHLAIGDESISIPLEKYEFSYSEYLKNEATYVFFDQAGKDKDKVIVINDGRNLCKIMENSFGMEYFVSNKNADYLLAVNWYVIEGVASAKEWLLELQKK